MKDKIYPAFYESVDNDTYLYSNSLNYYCLYNGKWEGVDEADAKDHESDENITREYLQNTCGVVESKEHAEFIVELAELHGFVDCGHGEGDNVFFFKGDNLVFLQVEDTSKSTYYEIEAKKITIPLPPKDGKQESDEWPKVGDNALHPACGLCKVASPADGNGVVAVLNEEGFNLLVVKSDLSKPKTPEVKLADELIARYKNLTKHEQAFAIARDIINNAIDKYDINPKASK